MKLRNSKKIRDIISLEVGRKYRRPVDVIQKKRDGLELTSDEIKWLIEGYVTGTVPDYQMSAFAMARYILKA